MQVSLIDFPISNLQVVKPWIGRDKYRQAQSAIGFFLCTELVSRYKIEDGFSLKQSLNIGLEYRPARFDKYISRIFVQYGDAYHYVGGTNNSYFPFAYFGLNTLLKNL